MKKLQKTLLAAGMIMFLSYGTMAQNATRTEDVKNPQNQVVKQGSFVDNDKNGICDNFEVRQKNSRGANFVDKNNDGICDHRGTLGQGQGRGKRNCDGQGYRHRHGNGGQNFGGRGQCFGGGRRN